MTDSALADRSFRRAHWSPHARVEDVVTQVRKATGPRVGFAAVMGALSLTVLPFTAAAVWLIVVVLWETAIRIFLEDRLALPAAAKSQGRGSLWLAGIHFVGACLFSFYPTLVWSSNQAIGMVLATAWVCGAANHLFVYFSANRPLLLACLMPLAGFAIAAPFLAEGWSIVSAVAAATLACLIFAAGLFGLDRRILLGSLARQAAARATAEEANAAKSQFLATMSHELRTPLNAVIGYAELIEEEVARGPVAEDAGKIRDSARQLLGVIDVILDLSKLEIGAVALERERMPAAVVLEQLREPAERLAAINENQLIIADARGLGEADLDHARLHQCLMQLVANAAKFTKRGEIRISATRSIENARACLCFSIADTGIGISAEHLGSIFEPFAQVEGHEARRFEGAGLGLALVRRLARLMGGDVECASKPGQGSTFTLWIDAGPA